MQSLQILKTNDFFQKLVWVTQKQNLSLCTVHVNERSTRFDGRVAIKIETQSRIAIFKL